jgi:hypothetical protein
VVVLAGCGRIGFDPSGVDADLGPWSTPTLVAEAQISSDDEDCTMSSTTTELIFISYASGNAAQLYELTRATPTSAWSAAVPLGIGGAKVGTPRLSPDDRTLYYCEEDLNAGDVFAVTRSGVGQPWGAPQPVVEVNTTTTEDKWLAVCETGYYVLVRDSQLYEGTLGGGPPVPIASFGMQSTSAMVTPDCLELYFADMPTGRIYLSARASTADSWGLPVAFEPLANWPYHEEDPWMSSDHRTFIFASDAGAGAQIYILTR